MAGDLFLPLAYPLLDWKYLSHSYSTPFPHPRCFFPRARVDACPPARCVRVTASVDDTAHRRGVCVCVRDHVRLLSKQAEADMRH